MTDPRIERMFHEARALPEGDRAAYLDRACGADTDARARVEALLRADEEATRLHARAAEPDATADLSDPAGERQGVGERSGQQVGRYRLLQMIGEGGFGSVWMAEQREPVKRRVAFKIIKLGMDTRQVIARFEAERQALAMMDHPNIAKVLDAGSTEQGRPYFVMEYIRGVPIVEYCDTEKLDTAARLKLFRKVCLAIQHAHQKGVIHRDIKPSNVLVTLHDGVPVPKVIDFGIAKAINQELTSRTLFTEHHQIIGTPAYMSPEQAEMTGLDIDTRSDIYALGVLLYELLTGSTPFDTKELMSRGFREMMRVIREETPHKPSTRLSSLGDVGSRATAMRLTDPRRLSLLVRGDLDWIVMKCLEKDRTRRYETANGLAEDIARHLRSEPVTAGPPSAAYRLRKFVRRNRAGVIAGGALAGALVLGTVGTSLGLVWAIRERDRADAAAEQARLAEADAVARAEQVERIAAFQSDQLSGIDAPRLGVSLRDALLHGVDEAGDTRGLPEDEAQARRAALEGLLGGVDFTGLALGVLEENIFAPALSAIDSGFDDQPAVRARLLQTLANTTASLGLYDFALAPQRTAQEIAADAFGPDDPRTIESRVHTGILMRSLGRFEDAERIYDAAVADSAAANGEDHRSTMDARYNLGVLYLEMDRAAEAEPLVRDALEYYRTRFGPRHLETLGTMNSLAVALSRMGRFDEAEQLYLGCVEGMEATLGRQHRRTIVARNNIATFYRHREDHARAEAMYRETLEDARRGLGEDHADTLMLLDNLGGTLFAQQRYDEAVRCAERALDGRRETLGELHPATLRSRYNVGMLQRRLGRTLEAETSFRAALDGFRVVYGEIHPHTIAARTTLSGLLLEFQRFADAERVLLEEEEALRPRTQPAARERYQKVVQALATFYGLWDQAEPDPRRRSEADRWRAQLEADAPSTRPSEGG